MFISGLVFGRMLSSVTIMLLFGILLSRSALRASGLDETYASANQNIFFNCEAANQLVMRILTNDSEIVWKWKGRDSDLWSSITLGPDTIVLDCIHEKVDDCSRESSLSELRLRNISLSKSGTYACYVAKRDNETLIQTKRLTVGHPPEEPVLTQDGCTLFMQESLMRCCWVLQNPPYATTVHKMEYTTHGRNARWTNCSETNDVCCEIYVENFFTVHEILITAKNIFGNKTSVRHEILPSWHIKPGSPTTLRLQTEAHGKMSTIIASWNAPNQSFAGTYDYKIRFSDAKTNVWRTEYGNKETRYVLEHLKSSTVYKIQVAARPVDTHGVNKGVWSDWSPKSSIRTEVAAPSKNLYFLRHNTTAMLVGGEQYISIQLEWNPYGNEKEDGFFNKITCENGSWKKDYIVRNGSSLRIATSPGNLFCNGAYCNIKGCSGYDSISIKQQEIPKAIENVRLTSLNKSNLSFAWDPLPAENVCSARICSRPRSFSDAAAPEVTPHNVCAIDGFRTLITKQINCMKEFISVIGNWNSCATYIVIMQTFYEDRSLLVQSHPSGISFYNPTIEKIPDFNVYDASTITNAKIEVSVSTRTPCPCMQQQIRYQPISGSECSGKSGTTCGEIFRQNVASNATHIFLSDNVFGGTQYFVSHHFACTGKDGPDVDGNMFSLETNGTRRRITTAASKPGSPRSATVVMAHGSGVARLSWNSPLHENGAVFYEVKTTKYTETSEKVTTQQVSKTTLTADIACSVGNNETKYSFAVAAVNKLEDGTLIRGGNASSETVSCLALEESHPSSSPTAAIIVVCISVLALALLAIVLIYHRKNINKKLKTHFSRIPKPILRYDIVTMNPTTEVGDMRANQQSRESYCSFTKSYTPSNDQFPTVITPMDNSRRRSHKIDDSFDSVQDEATNSSSSCTDGMQPGTESQDEDLLIKFTSGRDIISHLKQDTAASSLLTASGESRSTGQIRQYVKVFKPEPVSGFSGDECVLYALLNSGDNSSLLSESGSDEYMIDPRDAHFEYTPDVRGTELDYVLVPT